ncbi:MAG TPA: cyanophycin synthetase, partial [Herpetosiphonaceae bacterium]|nr:cyanophycin synthetase [Herpetosiphonaceae bacterium]
MRLTETKVYRGPNLYGYRPVIRWTLDLEALEDYPTTRLPTFSERLIELIPTLHDHDCSYGQPGGFVRRLHEGTWLGHVAEHIAIELQGLAGTHVTYGKTRSTGHKEGEYYVVYSYLEERVGLAAGRLALRLIQDLVPEELRGIEGLELLDVDDDQPVDAPFDFEEELAELIMLANRLALGPSTQ